MGTQADTARVIVRYLDELYDEAGAGRTGSPAWGTVPSDHLINMRVTGESLKHDKKTIRSGEIRGDRQQASATQVSVSAQGGLDFELSFDTQFVPMLGGALMASNPDWATPNTVTGASNISFAAAGKTITSSGSPAFATKFSVGQYIQVKATVSNGTTPAPKYYKIAAVTATVITVVETIVDESNTSAVITGSMIRNGVAPRCFTLEKQAADLTNVFLSYSGMMVNTFDLAATAEQIITAKLAFMGKKGLAGAATVGTGGAMAAGTTDPMNATSNVGSLTEGGSALATALRSVSLNVNNNLRTRMAVGTLGAIGIGKGRCAVSGKIEAYFEDLNLYTKFQNHTASSLHFRVSDAAGNYWFFTVPSLKLSTGDAAATGPDQDMMASFAFEADVDATTNCMIQVDRFAA